MLLKLRGGMDSFLVTILLAVLIAAFAIWGIGPGMLGATGDVVAKVGDQEIRAADFYRRVVNQAQQIQLQLGSDMSQEEVISTFRIDQQVLNGMIMQAAVDQHADDLGLRASDNQVVDSLITIDAFKFPDGTFSQTMLDQYLLSSGMTRAELFHTLRSDVERLQLLQSFSLVTPLPRGLAEKLYAWRAERRTATMINVPNTAVAEPEDPSLEVLQAYYDSNKDQYMTDRRWTYQYVLLTPEQFYDQVEVSDDELRATFEADIENYIQLETRVVRQVTLPDAAQAQAFIDAVNAGADFVSEATQRTSFAASELELGTVSENDLARDFSTDVATAVFDITAGGLTQPIAGLTGFDVFQVVTINPGESKTFDDVRSQVNEALVRERAIDLMFDFLPELEDAVLDEGSLSAAAARVNATLANVESVNAQGINNQGSQALTNPVDYRIFSSVQQMEAGEEARLFDVNPQDNQEGMFMLEVVEVMEPDQKSLDDVQNELTAAWKLEQRRLMAGDLAETVKERLTAGEAAEEIAQNVGGTSFAARNITRTPTGENSSLATNIRRLIFDLSNGETDLEAAADGNGYIIVRVDEVRPGNPETDPFGVNEIYTQITQSFERELDFQYQNFLRKQYETSINSALIQQLLQPNVQ